MSALPLSTVLITALVALGPLTMSTYAPAMPAIAQAFAADEGAVQLTLTIYLLGFAVSQLACGPLSDRFGRRRVVLWGLALFIAGSAACGLAWSVTALIVARFVEAAGACVGPAIGRAMVRDLYERDQAARVLAFVALALAVAPAVGPLMGGHISIWLGWRAVFAVLGGFAVLLTLSLRLLPETNRSFDRLALRPDRILGGYWLLLSNRTYLGYLAPAALLLGGNYAYYAVAPFLLINRLGVAPQQYGLLTLTSVLAYSLGSLLAARLGAALGLDRTIRLGSLCSLTGAGLLLVQALWLPATVAGLLGGMMLWTLGMGMALPNAMAGALAPFPERAGAASALMGFAQMAMGALGSLVLGHWHDGSWQPLALLLLALATSAIVSFRLLLPRPPATAPGRRP